MLTELCLQNFKTWKHTGSVRLAPITVFFGVNSSGKSSLGQFLLMLRRTIEQPDRNLVFHTADDSNPIDLGGYGTYVHNGNEKFDIDFNVQWDCPHELQIKDSLHKKGALSVRRIGFHGVVGTLPGPRERVICKEFDYRLNPSGDAQNALIQVKGQKGYERYELISEGFKAVKKQGRSWPLPRPIRFYGFPDELYTYYQNVADFTLLQLDLESIFKSIHYLGPLRQHPRRSYSWTGQAPSDVGFQGENTIAALLAGEEREISAGDGKRRQRLLTVVARWLKQLRVVDDFRVVNVAKNLRTYQVRLKMHGRPAEVNLLDVGFGVSQVLPVVTEAFYAPPHSTLILQQASFYGCDEVKRLKSPF